MCTVVGTHFCAIVVSVSEEKLKNTILKSTNVLKKIHLCFLNFLNVPNKVLE